MTTGEELPQDSEQNREQGREIMRDDPRGAASAALWFGGISLTGACCPPLGVLFAVGGLIAGFRGLASSARGLALTGMLLCTCGAVASSATGTLVGIIIVREEELQKNPGPNRPPFSKQ